MEMAAAAAGERVACCILDKVLNNAWDVVAKQCGYVYNYKSKITQLESKFAALKTAKGGVQAKVDDAKRESRIILVATNEWIDEFKKLDTMQDNIIKKVEKVDGGWFKGRLNLKQRYLLGKKAVKVTEEAERMLQGKPTYISGNSLPSGRCTVPTLEDSELLTSQSETISKIWKHLKNEENHVIGITGLPGSGKETMVKKIMNMFLEEELFPGQEEPMVHVVQVYERNMADIQKELAEYLGLKLKEPSEDAVARKLHERLRSSNILIILSNVSKTCDLKMIGVTSGVEHKGVKVVFTSQAGDVDCLIQAQKCVTVKVDPLPPDEQWILFKRMAGDCVEDEDLRLTAKEVLDYCGGLPIAIITLGKALKGGNEHLWTDVLNQLEKVAVTTLPDVEEKVYKPIQLSLNLLETRKPQAHRLLMICSLLPKDDNIPVQKLIRCAKGLPLCDDVTTLELEGMTNRVKSLIDDLKNRSLLQPGDKENTVKMHTVVRTVCLSIAPENPSTSSGPKYNYLVDHNLKLREWPHAEAEMKPHNAISLTLTSNNVQKNQNQLQLPECVDYPNLELLQLRIRYNSVNIPSQFFHGMEKVRVLDFMQNSSWRGLLQIENSLSPNSELQNLSVLSLESCDLTSGDLSWIGSLKKLEILSFFSSKLVELPFQVKKLGNLKCLDLRCAYLRKGDAYPERIPGGVLSSLKNLEDLYLGNYDAWQTDSSSGELASITELSSLSLLKSLQLRVKEPELLQPLIKGFENLKRFQIAAVRKESKFPEYETANSLELSKADWGMLSKPEDSKLLGRCKCLTLSGTGFKDIFKVFRNLGSIELSSCQGVEFIINEEVSAAALKNMKQMTVKDMNDLKEICKGELPAGSLEAMEMMKLDMLPNLTHLWGTAAIQRPSLGNLRAIEISFCKAISGLFSISVARSLMQLQKLDIKRCDMLNGIVSHEGVAAEKVVFPKLKFLSLDNLPNFKSFFPDSTMDGTIQHLFNELIELPSMNRLWIGDLENLIHVVDGDTLQESLLKLRSVYVAGCENLLSVATSDSIRFLESLERVEVRNCKSLEAVVDFEGFNVEGQIADYMVLSKLDSITLNNLDNFEHIWRMVPEGIQGFKLLRTLDISRCRSLTFVLSISVAKMLNNIRELKVKSCGKVEQIIEDSRESRSELTDEVRFPKLVDLQLDNLERLTSFSSSGNHDLEFLILEKVLIKKCPKLKTFCSGQVVTPKLRSMRYGDAQNDQDVRDLNTAIRYLHENRLFDAIVSSEGISTATPLSLEDDNMHEDIPSQANSTPITSESSTTKYSLVAYIRSFFSRGQDIS